MFAINSLAFTLPYLLVTPFAGALADRWNRRWLMILSDTGAGLGTLGLFLLMSGNVLEIWHVYLLTALSSAFSAFQWPAYAAATTMLVPKEQLGRASGLTQMSEAISRLLSPAIAGALFLTIGLRGIMLIDFITFAFAVVTLMVVRIPHPTRTVTGTVEEGSFLREAVVGWTYVRARPGLFGLLLYFAVGNFFLAMIGPLILPLMLNLSSADVVGISSSIIGLGMLAGTLLMSTWGGPERRVNGILFFGGWIGVFLALAGVRPSIPMITLAAFGVMFGVPLASGCSQALWQGKVAADVQGRVFAVRRMVAASMSPLALVLAGPLADNVFEPLLMDEGALVGSVGRVIGTGPGRGTGFIFILLGMFLVVATLLAYSHPRLRHLEDELPDAIVLPEEVEDPGSVVAEPSATPV
jgi:MFS family permease